MTDDGVAFSQSVLDRVAARNDPKCPLGWQMKYAARVKRDYLELQPWLPPSTRRIMDIGSGFAGVDVLLVRASGCRELHLIDGDGRGRREVGLHAGMQPWNDVAIGAQLVRDNVSNCHVTTAVVPPAPAPWLADLVISLKSWGHHYPVSMYLGFVGRCTSPGTIVILDVRKQSGGDDEMLAGGFECLGRAGGTVKTDRLVFRKVVA